MRSTAEIVIVGAGVLGCSIAYHLTHKGATDVVVLDKGAICSGETAKSGGFIQTHWSSLNEVRLIDSSRSWFWEWTETFEEDCKFIETGYLHVTGPEQEEKVRACHQMLLDEGIESHWLKPIELKRLQPILNVRDLVGGAYEPRSGWADPVATTLSIAGKAKSQGAEFIEGVQVRQLRQQSGRVTGVETDRGFLSCPTVILAAGPWTPLLHPDPSTPLPIRVKRGQVCYTDRPVGLPSRELAFYDEITGLYTHTDGDCNLVGIDWYFEPVWHPDTYDTEIDGDYVEAALGALGHRFPALGTAGLKRGVVGLYDFTPDGHPIIDGPIGGLDGYYVAAGFSGAGFKSAPMTGLGLAELVLEGKFSSVDIAFLGLDRFTESNSWHRSS